MADGLFLVGTDRGVGKTLIGVALVALLREQGVDATLMTPISTGGSTEKPSELLREIGVEEPPRLVTPVVYETLASPYVASRVEGKAPDVDRVLAAYQELKQQGRFIVVEGGGALVPITRSYNMTDLLKEMDIPSVIVGRTGRGTLNHCLLTLRMLLAMGINPLGFILNGFGQYGDGFAESLNPDALQELAAPCPVLATLEWRPEFQSNLKNFIRALNQPQLVTILKHLARP
jgi:dethiobiotin synthetase